MRHREMRDQLISILSKPIYPKEGVDPAEVVADYLLDNGVVVLPRKEGDTVWFNTWEKNGSVCVGVLPHTIDRIDISFVCGVNKLIPTSIPDYAIGKTVFLTKEEAEQATKGV